MAESSGGQERDCRHAVVLAARPRWCRQRRGRAGNGLGSGRHSPATADDISRLLLRFGISVEIRGSPLSVFTDVDDQRRFLQEIGYPGEDAAACCVGSSSRRIVRTSRSAARAVGAWQQCKELRACSRCGRRAARIGFAAASLQRVTSVLRTPPTSRYRDERRDLGHGPVDRPASAQRGCLRRDCAHHGTISSPMASRSTTRIEQDADMVVLLHRDDSTKASPRAPAKPTLSSPSTVPVRRDHHGRFPGSLLALRGHGAELALGDSVRRSMRALSATRERSTPMTRPTARAVTAVAT